MAVGCGCVGESRVRVVYSHSFRSHVQHTHTRKWGELFVRGAFVVLDIHAHTGDCAVCVCVRAGRVFWVNFMLCNKRKYRRAFAGFTTQMSPSTDARCWWAPGGRLVTFRVGQVMSFSGCFRGRRFVFMRGMLMFAIGWGNLGKMSHRFRENIM